MSIANDIINQKTPDFDFYIHQGESLDDLDEYGFTPLIECAIANQIETARQLIDRGVDVNKGDMTDRTALHWAIDNNNIELIKLLLKHGANPNAYALGGLPILVFPLLREQQHLKHLLYQHGAKIDFALDFIQGKLIGHRFELRGDVDILTADNRFIELDYEGFILEFTVAIIGDSLRRFLNSYSTRHLRNLFPRIYPILEAFTVADELLQMQHYRQLTSDQLLHLDQMAKMPLLILPAASQGHAMGFIKYHNWWAKIDRGENSLKEGCVNIYRITRPQVINGQFLREFLFKRQKRQYFHQDINHLLGLLPVTTFPLTPQRSGNCSWANIQGIVGVGYAMQLLQLQGEYNFTEAVQFYETWNAWDRDRAVDECIQRFYHVIAPRKASLASMLASVLFHVCKYDNPHHLIWAEKILSILALPDYQFILQRYLEVHCMQRLTQKGNNLLKILEDCGIDINNLIN